MTHHENESIIDKVKNALGMGHDDHHEDDGHDHGHETPVAAGSGAAAPMAGGDVENRPGGPDYGSSDAGNDADADADLGRGSVAEPAVTGTATGTAPDAPMTRGEAASGRSGIVDEDDTFGSDRRETGV